MHAGLLSSVQYHRVCQLAVPSAISLSFSTNSAGLLVSSVCTFYICQQAIYCISHVSSDLVAEGVTRVIDGWWSESCVTQR